MKMILGLVILAVLIVAVNEAKAGTDTLTWGACTEYTDGSPLPPEELAGYRIYLGDISGGPYTLIGETTDLTAINTTPAGKTKYYVVTCVTVYDLESAYSLEAVKEGKRAKAPGQLRAE